MGGSAEMALPERSEYPNSLDGQDVRRKSNIRLIIAAIALTIANLRPSAMGTAFTTLADAVLIVLDVWLISELARTGAKFSLPKAAMPQLVFLVLITAYVLIDGLLLPTLDHVLAIKDTINSVIFLVSLVLVISLHDDRRYFFDFFAGIVVVSCICVCIASVLLAIGISTESLKIASLDSDAMYVYGDFVFPGTFAFDKVPTSFGTLVRLSGIFREPGVLPPFACWAAVYAYRRQWPTIVTVVCVIASVVCLSSMGVLGLYVAGFLVLSRLGIKPGFAVVAILAVGMTVWPLLASPDYVGMSTKVMSSSYMIRQYMWMSVLNTENWFFGDGHGWAEVASNDEGISLIVTIRVYGLVYFFLVMGFYLTAIKDRELWIIGIVPTIVTILMSQPIAVSPGTVVFLFSWLALDSTKSAKADVSPRSEPSSGIGAVPDPVS